MLIDSLFLLCPLTELPLLDRGARMDMLDYYEARMEARGTNRMGGISVLTEKTDSILTLRLTDISTWQMEILPPQSKKHPSPTLRCTHTLTVPGLPDRKTIHLYDTNWVRKDEKKKRVLPPSQTLRFKS